MCVCVYVHVALYRCISISLCLCACVCECAFFHAVDVQNDLMVLTLCMCGLVRGRARASVLVYVRDVHACMCAFFHTVDVKRALLMCTMYVYISMCIKSGRLAGARRARWYFHLCKLDPTTLSRCSNIDPLVIQNRAQHVPTCFQPRSQNGSNIEPISVKKKTQFYKTSFKTWSRIGPTTVQQSINN